MNDTTRKFMMIFTMLCSIAFIIIGVMREENMMVMKKAILVCLECIGIGG